MWFASTTIEQLIRLTECDSVGEIIIVNNRISHTPRHPVLAHSKIVLLNQEQNLYVNPSWNLGVQQAKNHAICIANDDIVFDPNKIFPNISEQFLQSSGLVGLNPVPPEQENISLIPMSLEQVPWGFGCLMCIHKLVYAPVPHGLNVFYGDTWLIKRLINLGIYYVEGLTSNIKHSTTWNNQQPEIKTAIDTAISRDYERWPQVVKEYHL
jgi:hypothetical protein